VWLVRMLSVLTIAVGAGLAMAAEASANAGEMAPGDLVRIEVFDNPDLAVTVRVPLSGSVTLPLIGRVDDLAGRQTEMLAGEIRTRLEDGYLRRAEVTVTVLEFAPRTASVMGAVGKPGAVALHPARATAIMQAIGECGGFLDDADRQHVRVLRQGAAAGQAELVNAAEDEIGMRLRPGDVVLVPRLDRVYVLGRVQRPGPIALPTSEVVTVSKAISMAGGFDRFARDGSVQLLHNVGAAVLVDVGAILAGKAGSEDPVLKPGDTVFVPQSRF
jgi:polysaccharide export outer membrane protein